MKSFTTNKLVSGLTIATLALALSIGVSYVLAVSTYSEPTCGPTTPNCNTDAPLNVGASTQEKLGGLVINTQSPSNANGLDVFGLSRFYGNVEIGTTTIPKKIKIVDGNQALGKVLTSDANGLASWAPAGGDAYCTTPVITDVAAKGYYNVPLTVNGRNICSDGNGCTFNWFFVNDNGNIAYEFYGEGPISHIQNSSGSWYNAANNKTGVNGDGTKDSITSDTHDQELQDDLPIDDPAYASVYTENSPDFFTLEDRSNSVGSHIFVCDF